jgi:3,4-dihydroxy 2-butanone 4-phosphate synthase/GTP cyclohydrolase II
MAEIEAAGRGVLVYLAQEGRGIGLVDKLRAYELQQNGRDTVDANVELGHAADPREYHAAAHILRDLQVKSVRLMTNNPHKVEELETYGVPVTERLAHEVVSQDSNRSYLRTKRDRLGHILSDDSLSTSDTKVQEPSLAG